MHNIKNMKKKLIVSPKVIFILQILFLSFLEINAQEYQLPLLIEKVEKSVFTVYAMNCQDQMYSQGSGFFIDPSGIGITNFHVLDGAYKAKIKLHNGEIIPIESILDYDRKKDLVKFTIKKKETSYPFLHLTNILAKRGTSIVCISSPLGLEKSVSTGIVSAIRDNNRYGKIIQITAPISHGSSGSPIVNMKGEVLGVSTFAIEKGQSLNFAVSTLEINSLYKKNNYSLYDIWNDPLETINVRRAIELRDKGDTISAIQLLQQEIVLNKNNHLAMFELGTTLCQKYQKKDTVGIEYIINACKLDSLNAKYWNGLGVHISNLNDLFKGGITFYKTAQFSYYNALKIEPEANVIYTNLASLYYKSYHVYKIITDKTIIDLALDCINKAISLNPCAGNYVLRARIHVAKKEIGSALLDCDNSISFAPEYSDPYFIRGDIKAFELSDYYGGLADIEKALALVDYNYPNLDLLKYYKSDMLGLRGTIYNHLMVKEKNPNFWQKIKESFEEAYKLNPDETYSMRKSASYFIYLNLLQTKN